jgi:type II secretory pathway pseudopilin PulG
MSQFPVSPYSQPMPPQKVPGRSTAFVVVIVLLVLLVLLMVCAGLLAALLLPAIARARNVARQSMATNHMRELSVAMLNYEATFRACPAGIVTRSDGSGKPFGSIATALLPFTQAGNFDPSKAWDDPANQAAQLIRPIVYRSPMTGDSIGSNETTVFFITDPNGMLGKDRCIKFRELTDGLSNTIFAIDAGTSPHPWYQPDEVDTAEAIRRVQASTFEMIPVAFADGSSQMLRKDTLLESLPGLVDRDDGFVLDLNLQ